MRFTEDVRAELEVKNIISLALGIIVLAAVLPVAFDTFYTANTTAWSTSVISLWALVPLFAIIGVIVALVAVAVGKKGGI